MGDNAAVPASVTEAMRKAAVAWLRIGAAQPFAVWCLWQDGALYVVSGTGEQPAPGLAAAGAAEVTARGDHGGAIVTWPAVVARVEPGSAEWAVMAPTLAAKRLNSAAAADLVQRWAAGATLSRLSPAPAGGSANRDPSVNRNPSVNRPL